MQCFRLGIRSVRLQSLDISQSISSMNKGLVEGLDMRVWVLFLLSMLGMPSFLKAQDSLVYYEITSGTGQSVFSAQLTIPPGVVAHPWFISSNTNPSNVFNQGLVVNYPDASIVQYQVGNYYTDQTATGISAWAKRDLPNSIAVGAAGTSTTTFFNYTDGSRIIGPCTLSFFCRDASLFGCVYLAPDLLAPYYIRKLVKPSEGSFQVNIPTGHMASVLKSSFGRQAMSVKYLTGSGKYINTDAKYFNSEGLGYSSAAIIPSFICSYDTTSNVVPWARQAVQFNRKLETQYPGPGSIICEYTNTADQNSLGIILYYVAQANFSTSSAGTTNGVTNTASTQTKNINLVVERSTDLQNWSAIDSLYVTEIADKAFYRVKIVPN